jgi:hypothetical protein
MKALLHRFNRIEITFFYIALTLMMGNEGALLGLNRIMTANLYQ